ncbi:pilus assembly protein PilM [Geminisphaera colitermitum]|uniref:pilus assembly protein PilM n=1 Tax=Geminisphaera colitermitum TaxID=1148786 RepID=UPI000158D02A|nr:pilus assembly protein PilM [Geminisphaera colitermitum]
MASPRVLAVDCGAGHVACGLFTKDKTGRLTLERLAVETFNPDAAQEADWPLFFGESLTEIVRRERFSGAVTLALPGHHTLSKFVKTPAVDKSKRERIIAFEAQQNIPYPLSEVVWDHVTVSDDGLDMEVMLAAAKLDIAESICAAVAEAGLTVEKVTASTTAVLRCFRANYADFAEGVIIVDIGARSTDLIFTEPHRFFIRTIPHAGNTITQHISDEIKQDFSHSESLKVQVLSGQSELPETSPARHAVTNAVQSFIGRLHLEITRSTVNYRRQSGASQPVAVLLTGGGSLIPGLAQELSARLKMPVEAFDPLRTVGTTGKAADAAEVATLLPALIGLAVPAAKDEKILNMVPPTIKKRLEFRSRVPFMIAAAAIVALAFVPPVIQAERLRRSLNAQLGRLNHAILPLQTIQNRNDTNIGKIAALRKQVDAIHVLAEGKSNWVNFLTDLQDRLHKTGDVWLDQLVVIRAGGPQGGGGGGGGLFGGRGAPAPATNADIVRLHLSGRLLDVKNPISLVSQDSYAQVKTLLESFRGSQFIANVESERFDATMPGILRFDFILVVNPKRPL